MRGKAAGQTAHQGVAADHREGGDRTRLTDRLTLAMGLTLNTATAPMAYGWFDLRERGFPTNSHSGPQCPDVQVQRAVRTSAVAGLSANNLR
jgi:hypothetical protein